MSDNVVKLCRQCAVRLGRYTAPDVPELLEGQCPQCGAREMLEPAAFAAPAPLYVLEAIATPEPSAGRRAA